MTQTGGIADLQSITLFTGEHGSIKERVKKKKKATPLLLSLDVPKPGVCIQPRDPQADTGNWSCREKQCKDVLSMSRRRREIHYTQAPTVTEEKNTTILVPAL